MRVRAFCWLSILLSGARGLYSQPTGSDLSLASHGWELIAAPNHASLTLKHEKLGVLLDDLRLNIRNAQGLSPLEHWSAGRTGPDTLSIATTNPPASFLFHFSPDTVQISSTSADAVITAVAPAPGNRFPARLLDPQGAAVTWSGTGEVANGYDGAETHNPSFLPQHNPDVMYFSLGQISGDGLHSLFDRKTDIAIAFATDVSMSRDPRQEAQLNLTIPVVGNTTIRLTPDYFTKTLGAPYFVPFDDRIFPKAPMVWSSWTGYYAEVTEGDMVRNADWIADHLKPYGFQYVQLDDGYDRGKKGEHYWIENWDRTKFPHGPQWLTDHIKSKGLRAGIWLVPNAYAGAVEQHPGWYVRDKRGQVILDYKTPTLDSSNPEVLGFLKKLFTTLDGWGFEYYKFDGEHAFSKYVPAVDRTKLHDPSIDPLVTYRNRLQLIRETVGPGTFIEGCPAGTPLNGIQYFNSYFNGDDVYNSWQGMYPLFSSINANAFLNHLLVYVMPGEGIDVSPFMTAEEGGRKRNATFNEVAGSREKPLTGFGTTLPEARTLVSYVALTGVVYPLASILPELPEERVKLLKMTLPTMPIYPVDLFSRGTDMSWDKFRHVRPDTYIHNYPETLDLKVSAKSGVYDVVGLTNWRSTPVARQLSFSDKLGLPADTQYVVFDYWKQKLLGVYRDRIDLTVEPHDTRVLAIHKLLNHPQLVGTSRHITGAYSVEDLRWDATANALRGTSETIPGERYSLTFALPTGVTVSSTRVTGPDGSAIPARQDAAEQNATANSLELSFQASAASATWEIEFTR